MIRANFFLARDQCLELGLLDRFFGARGLTAFSRLDLRKDLLIGEPFERRFYRGFPLSFLDQFVKVLDELQVMLPHLVDSLRNGLVLVGERDHAHRLREVRVARGADEQAVGVAARLLHEGTEPESRTIAMPEGIRWQLDRVDDRALGLAALAPDPDLGEISASPSFVDPGGRRPVVRPPWAKAYQSMSPMCPFLHALTKRIGTTDCGFLSSSMNLLVPVSEVRWT